MRQLSPISTEFPWPRRSLSRDLVGEVLTDFDRIVESFLRPTYATTVGFQPTCDVSETESHILVSFDMPGVKKEDIKIEVKGTELMISGERSRHAERMFGSFQRTFILPDSVDTEKVEAQYENGVLSVAIPKVESAKPRTVEIQTGSGGFFNKLLGSKKEDTKELKDVKNS